MHARRLCSSALALALLGAGACVDPMEAPSAYTSLTNLCSSDNAAAYQKAIDECRQAFAKDKSCGGVLSFEGQIQARPVTVEATQLKTSVTVLQAADGGAPLLDEVATSGSSPYFNFTTKFRSVGGREESLAGQSRVLSYAGAPNAPSVPDPLEDEKVLFTLRLDGAESVVFTATTGNLTITEQTAEDVVGTFDTTFGSADDHVTGCFHVLPQAQTTEPVPIQ